MYYHRLYYRLHPAITKTREQIVKSFAFIMNMSEFKFNPPKRSKYGNNKTVVDNQSFDSQKEAYRYLELKQKQKDGLISGLKRQPVFELQEKFIDNQGKKVRAIEYVGDFQYIEGNATIVEDVKGFATKDFKLKEKMFRFKFREYIFRKT